MSLSILLLLKNENVEEYFFLQFESECNAHTNLRWLVKHGEFNVANLAIYIDRYFEIEFVRVQVGSKRVLVVFGR